MDLDRIEQELEALLAQQAAPDVPAWAALLTQRARYLMQPDVDRLAQSQDLTSRLMQYLRTTRDEDSAQLAALRRTAALHEVIQALAHGRLDPSISLEG